MNRLHVMIRNEFIIQSNSGVLRTFCKSFNLIRCLARACHPGRAASGLVVCPSFTLPEEEGSWSTLGHRSH